MSIRLPIYSSFKHVNEMAARDSKCNQSRQYTQKHIERKKNKMLVYNKEKSTTQPGVLYSYRINKDTFDSRETPFSQERNTTNVGSCGKE